LQPLGAPLSSHISVFTTSPSPQIGVQGPFQVIGKEEAFMHFHPFITAEQLFSHPMSSVGLKSSHLSESDNLGSLFPQFWQIDF